jgi:hypothetical protein
MQRRTSRAQESGNDLEKIDSNTPETGQAPLSNTNKGSTSATDRVFVSAQEDPPEANNEVKYLNGWRFYCLTAA